LKRAALVDPPWADVERGGEKFFRSTLTLKAGRLEKGALPFGKKKNIWRNL